MELMKMQIGGWRVRPTRDPCCPLPPRERVVTFLDSVSSSVERGGRKKEPLAGVFKLHLAKSGWSLGLPDL